MTSSPAPARRRKWMWGAAAVLIVGAGLAGLRAARSTVDAMSETAPIVPTARVERGALDMTVHMTGEVRASSQQAVMAPSLGTSLRILTLVDSGAVVGEGDLILSFDPADQLYNLEQAESELLEAEQNITKRKADIGAQDAADQVALLTARFNVRRAELDAAVDRDLIPANEYQIRQVSLQEARRSLEQTESDVKARATVSAAGLSVLEEARMKAKLAADVARQNMEHLEIRSPIDGVVSIRDNLDGQTVLYSGMSLPAYRAGDTTNSGRPILDIFDVSGMEIRATVNEQDRANLSPGQAVVVESDSVPGLEASAKLVAVSGLGRAVMREGPLRRFDVTCALDTPDPRLRPGTSVRLRVAGPTVEDALIVPRQAVFEQDGRTVVYARVGEAFEARDVKVTHRSESQAAIEGVEAGTDVALIAIDPEGTASAGASSGAQQEPVVGR